MVNELQQMLDMLKSISKPIVESESNTENKDQKIPSIPVEYLRIIMNMICFVFSFMFNIIGTILGLVFDMLLNIVDVFKTIKGVIGVPEIPYPLSLVPDMIELIPQVKSLIFSAPQQMKKIVERLVMDKMKELQNLTMTEFPSMDAMTLEGCDICDKHAKKQIEKKIQDIENNMMVHPNLIMA